MQVFQCPAAGRGTRRKGPWLLAVLLVLLGVAACGEGPAPASHPPAAPGADARLGNAVLTDVFIQPPGFATSGGDRAAGLFFTVTWNGVGDGQLSDVKTPIAERAVVLDPVYPGSTPPGQPVHLDLMPGVPLPLRPGGRHVRLVGVTAPLVPGVSYPVTFTFAGAGELTVQVPVLRSQL